MKIVVVILVAFIICIGPGLLKAQEEPALPQETVYEEPITQLWLNTYGNIRISDRFFWVAQTHLRFREDDQTPFVGQVRQIYNRHAISYLVSKSFNLSLGGVLRININDDLTENERGSVPEWRIWHEYQFAIPLDRIMIYHRLRIEHRWSQGYAENSEYFFRNRWRYMFKAKIPLNKPYLGPGTLYLSPEAELIMQSGERVVNSPMEDLRLHTSINYIINPRLTVASGLMYSQGQELINGAFFNQRWTMRFHIYFAPDLRKVKNKLPAIHMTE